MTKLIYKLNKCRNSYYNENFSIVSDEEYDNLFDELKELEIKTNTVFSNSPTTTVGYEVKSKLEKVKHEFPMLSLDKTKDIDELIRFTQNQECLLMHKLDGLTVMLTYECGDLIKAETRGNGEIGEDITHNARTFSNIPLQIPLKEKLVVVGEAIITYKQFEKINEDLPEGSDKYKTPRNLVSGTVRQLDSKICKDREVLFVVFDVRHGLDELDTLNKQLQKVDGLGFIVVDYCIYNSADGINLNVLINNRKEIAQINSLPIDGLVMKFNDVAFGNGLGRTSHHFNNAIAFKFYDEEVITILRSIEWSMGRTGTITPVAVFDAVELDGTDVNRASLHNLSVCKNLELGIDDHIIVYKANMIIPQVKSNLTRSNNFIVPQKCPICGEKTTISKENESEVLMCTNEGCKGKLLGKLRHFTSKAAMNIEGLSEATLETLLTNELISDYFSIYELKDKREELLKLPRFGKRKVDNLLHEIEKSKVVKLENFIYALGIPLIGRSASKTISKYFNGDFYKFYNETCIYNFDFRVLEDFGQTMHFSIRSYFETNCTDVYKFAQLLRFSLLPQDSKNNSSLKDKVFVVTGSLHHYKNREELQSVIVDNGGKISSSISSKTSYLINNDATSTSGKNKKAKELGVKIITEDEFLKMIKGDI